MAGSLTNQFKASNGFKFRCNELDCRQQYDISDNRLWLDISCRGKPIDLKAYLDSSDFKDLQTHVEQFQVALKELKEAFLKAKLDKVTFAGWVII